MAFSARIFGNKCRALLSMATTDIAAAAAELKVPPPSTAMLNVQPISDALAKFLGSAEASRSDASKKILAYVWSNNLQNPANVTEIYCDDTLKAIFDGNEKVDFKGAVKLLEKHFRLTTSGILKVQPAFTKFLGSAGESRSEAVKKVWDYVKSNNLRKNPDNNREIYCDDTLKEIFDGKDKVTFGDFSKLLATHFVNKTT